MAVNQNSLNNLTPITDKVTQEEMIENGRKGGKASGKARREKKEMRERIRTILEMGITDGRIQDFKSFKDVANKNISIQDAILIAQVKKALKGDTRAVEFLRDTAGMKPSDKKEITATITDSPLQGILNQLNNDDSEENNQ